MGDMEMWELVVRESVRQTLADYTAGTDRNRIADVAACFAPDGTLTFTGGEPMVGPDGHRGGTAAHRWIGSRRARFP